MHDTLKRDSYGFGTLMALGAPLIAMLFFYYLLLWISKLIQLPHYGFRDLYLLSLTANILLMRYYLVSIKMVRTGKGILITTFVLVAIFFIFIS
ncbi:MAG TPA: hypothetical protein VFC92_14245 [Bacteroidales bacterium]|nr:hypothetical protein [Bacteroidales bacterium]